MYAPNNRGSNYMRQKKKKKKKKKKKRTVEQEGEIDKSTLIVRDINAPPSEMNRSSRHTTKLTPLLINWTQ